MPRALLIVNPLASGVSDERAHAVALELRQAGEVETVWTERPLHAAELARREANAIVVFSGDGGYNEVLNGLTRDVPVGFVPGGGTSVLPRALGLPRDATAAARCVAEALQAGRTRRISLGRVNGRRFAFAAGIGLDAELVRRVNALGRSRERGRAGNLAFAWTAAKLLMERRARFDRVLEIDGLGRAALAFVANTDPYTYAGPLPLHVAPHARFELGLDLVAPQRVRAHDVPRLAGYAVLGRGQTSAADVHYAHDRDSFVIRCDAPLALQADGEDLGDVTEARFEAERAAVRILA